KVTSAGAGSPNRLLYTGPATVTPPPAPKPLPPALVVANPGARSTVLGTTASLQLTATGGTTPYTWKANGLPTGLTINTAGLISGTPTVTGTWTVFATATDAARKIATTTFTWTVAKAVCPPVANVADVRIRDLTQAVSTVNVTGCVGKASTASIIEIHVRHSARGQLVVELVAPDGTVYPLLSHTGGTADNIDQRFTRNLSAENANGVWQLRVRDTQLGDSGYVDRWMLDL
ncbi:proprotein convertase P-domain-containing protein, partial [Actinophytocola xanthii]